MTDKFTPNDYVTVTLSAPGAEVLNEKGKYPVSYTHLTLPTILRV